jgi:SAM-dependent methyltransferase
MGRNFVVHKRNSIIKTWLDMLVKLMQFIARKKAPVNVQDLTRIRPVSSNFGWERGTPVDRYYIENFFREHGSLIRGRVLEVGGSYYSKRFSGSEVESFDALHVMPGNRGATIIGDLTDVATLPVNSFDCFICAQTFQYIFNVRDAIEGAHYLLKPSGVLLATVPGISQISRYDAPRYGEYWRFTKDSLQKLFEPIFSGCLEIESFGNVIAATAFLQGVAVEDLPDPSLLDRYDPDYQLLLTILARKAL